MKKVMTILAVAALSASTAFAGPPTDAVEEPDALVTERTTGTPCTNSIGEAVACGALAACLGGLCGGGNSSGSSSPSSSSSSSDSM